MLLHRSPPGVRGCAGARWSSGGGRDWLRAPAQALDSRTGPRAAPRLPTGPPRVHLHADTEPSFLVDISAVPEAMAGAYGTGQRQAYEQGALEAITTACQQQLGIRVWGMTSTSSLGARGARLCLTSERGTHEQVGQLLHAGALEVVLGGTTVRLPVRLPASEPLAGAYTVVVRGLPLAQSVPGTVQCLVECAGYHGQASVAAEFFGEQRMLPGIACTDVVVAYVCLRAGFDGVLSLPPDFRFGSRDVRVEVKGPALVPEGTGAAPIPPPPPPPRAPMPPRPRPPGPASPPPPSPPEQARGSGPPPPPPPPEQAGARGQSSPSSAAAPVAQPPRSRRNRRKASSPLRDMPAPMEAEPEPLRPSDAPPGAATAPDLEMADVAGPSGRVAPSQLRGPSAPPAKQSSVAFSNFAHEPGYAVLAGCARERVDGAGEWAEGMLLAGMAAFYQQHRRMCDEAAPCTTEGALSRTTVAVLQGFLETWAARGGTVPQRRSARQAASGPHSWLSICGKGATKGSGSHPAAARGSRGPAP
jgi:hypothetical protein